MNKLTNKDILKTSLNSDGILRLSLNNPNNQNTLSEDMMLNLQSALNESIQDKKTRVIIISAEGPIFSAGHDLKELKAKRQNSDKGKAYFNKTKSLDHVQALVVKEGKILAKEGREGTKKMLSKLKKKSEGILIKLPKKKQDLRMDLPTIGIQTLKDIKKYGLRGVILQSKKNIFLNKNDCIKFANKNKIFINII